MVSVRQSGQGARQEGRRLRPARTQVLAQIPEVSHRGDVMAITEVFACEWLLHEDGIDTKTGFDRFKGYAETILAVPGANAALIWDRVGHWAQTDHDWQQAEAAFRNAFDLEPNHYAYCLGVALNHLDRFEDALAVLSPATELADADSLVWFQTAFANERIGDVRGAAEGYRRAIALEPGYALAHFNLGGVLWNDGQEDEAGLVWREAIVRFPEHELAAKLEKDLAHVFATLQNR
jgi:tetratricopeptide (TPR) repeat protein